jgi:hypothetical protein
LNGSHPNPQSRAQFPVIPTARIAISIARLPNSAITPPIIDSIPDICGFQVFCIVQNLPFLFFSCFSPTLLSYAAPYRPYIRCVVYFLLLLQKDI